MEGKKTIRVTVVEPRGTGGMIHYAYQLCDAMAKEGADITLVTSLDYELHDFPHNFHVKTLMKLWPQVDPLLSKVPRNKLEGIWRKIFWNGRRVFRAIRLIIEWIRLTNYLVKTRPDIVQFGVSEFAFEVFFLDFIKRRGILLSQICHEFERRQARKNFFTNLDNQLNRNIYKTFSAIFLHGESNLNGFLTVFDIPKERLHSIRHGNEQIFPKVQNADEISSQLKRKYQLTSEHHPVLFFGNITPSKGVPDLIQAFKHVHEKDPQARLIVAGMPSKQMNMNALTQLAVDLQISEKIVFDSRYLPMEEIQPLIQLADVVVFPYRSISQSGALQVAYAFGKPVVATNVGGFPEAVDNGESGFLVPVESPKEMADAILKIIKNPGLAQKMGTAGKNLSETRFAWEPIARDVLKVYESLVTEKPTA